MVTHCFTRRMHSLLSCCSANGVGFGGQGSDKRAPGNQGDLRGPDGQGLGRRACPPRPPEKRRGGGAGGPPRVLSSGVCSYGEKVRWLNAPGLNHLEAEGDCQGSLKMLSHGGGGGWEPTVALLCGHSQPCCLASRFVGAPVLLWLCLAAGRS